MKATAAKLSLVALMTIGASIASAQSVRVTVDGDPVNFRGTGPRIVGQRVMVPLRGVFEEMGATVDWDSASRTVSAMDGDTDIELKIGDRRAIVDGEVVMLDVPAMLMGGRTMVPLRFLSESLGANVEWNEPSKLVMITTSGTDRTDRDDTIVTVPPRILVQDTVIPVSLDNTLRSNEARIGDTFTATLRPENSDIYAGLPSGTKVVGRVIDAKAQKGNEPGILELDFTHIRLPDGRQVAMDGSLISLDNTSVTRNENGVLEAKGDKKDDRLIYAGYGAGAGLIVGLLTKKPLEGAILGGLLGLLVGVTNKDKENPTNVVLNPGTKFGVRLDQDLTIR
jgi:hypothetical protein